MAQNRRPVCSLGRTLLAHPCALLARPCLPRPAPPAPQTLVSRETSPFGHSVVSVTRLSAGDAFNVIPDVVKIGGTVRSSSDEHMQVRSWRSALGVRTSGQGRVGCMGGASQAGQRVEAMQAHVQGRASSLHSAAVRGCFVPPLVCSVSDHLLLALPEKKPILPRSTSPPLFRPPLPAAAQAVRVAGGQPGGGAGVQRGGGLDAGQAALLPAHRE